MVNAACCVPAESATLKLPLAPLGPPGTSISALVAAPNWSAWSWLAGVPAAVFAAIVTCSRPAPPGTTATLTTGRGLHGLGVDVGAGAGVSVGVVSVGVVSVGVAGVGELGVGVFGVGVLAAPVTVIVPVMKGWMLQKYGKLPVELNVKPNDWPVFRNPESQTPELLVLVWVVVPFFVHVTRVPTETVSALGWKSKSTIETALPWA